MNFLRRWFYWYNVADEPRSVRFFLHRKDSHRPSELFKLEGYFASRFGIGASVAGGTMMLDVWPFKAWFTNPLPRWMTGSGKTELYLFWMDSGLVFSASWRCQEMHWPPQFGWSVWFHLADVIFGRHKYAEGSRTHYRISVPMPERTYTGDCFISEDTWKRPRWPFTERLRRAKIDMDKDNQIPVPGKGENAWDCGEDAIYGLTTEARDVKDAIAKIADSATRTRLKYGGQNWKPEAAA